MDQKERENFYRSTSLIVDHIKEGFVDLITFSLNLTGYASFEDFINFCQHELYHMCYNRDRCCQCSRGYILPKSRILYPSQLDLLFTRSGPQKICHNITRRRDFCCCVAKSGLNTSVLDVTLARCLLINFCHEVFWYDCLTFHSKTLEEFLSQNKHHLFHSYVITKCCKCPASYVLSNKSALLDNNQWRLLFGARETPCFFHRNNPVPGQQVICSVSVTPGIIVSHLDPNTSNVILDQCCLLRKAVEKLVHIRNKIFGHAHEARISDSDYNKYQAIIEYHLLVIGKICKKENEVKEKLHNLTVRPLDSSSILQTIRDQVYRTDDIKRVCIICS